MATAKGKTKPLNALEIMGLADSYRNTASNLVKNPDGRYVPVQIALWAFALELYLKALYLAINKQRWTKNEHDLFWLFGQLPAAVQKEIGDGWKAQRDRVYPPRQIEAALIAAGRTRKQARATINTTFAAELKRGAKAFQEWRYHFEHERPDLGDFTHAIPKLRELIEQYAAQP